MTRPIRCAPLLVSACSGLFIFGITLAVLGTVFGLPQMRERLHLDLAHQGHVFLFLYLGVFTANLFVGPIIDSIGHKWVMLVSALMVAGALVAFSSADSFASVIPPAILLGFAGGGLNTASNALVSELYGEKRGGMLNLVGAFFGVGALGVPLLAAGTEGRFSVTLLLWCAAGLTVLGALLYAVVPFPRPREAGRASIADTFRVLRYPGMLFLGILLFMEAGNEAAIGGWTSTYAGAAGMPPRTATLVLACYWAAMIAGRVLASWIVPRFGKVNTILASALVAVVGCVLLLSASSLVMLAIGATVIGLSFGPIFQTGLGIAGDRYQRHSGSIFGLMFAFALAGSMAFPWAVGQISQVYAVRYGMFVPLAGAVCISVMGAVLKRREPSSRQEQEPSVDAVQV